MKTANIPVYRNIALSAPKILDTKMLYSTFVQFIP